MTEDSVLIYGEDSFLSSPAVDTSLPVKVVAISHTVEVVNKLLRLYGDVTVTVEDKKVKLSEVGEPAVIELPAQENFNKQRYGVLDAMRVIDRLMQRPGGCPWDSVQTHESIRINMIEEAYEAVDAIDKHDLDNMNEEFGDVLLQSLLQSRIAAREGEFDFGDVCDGLCKKLIGRHSFIFGGDSAGSADDAITLWEKNKAVEKKYSSVKEQLQKLPENFPALLYAQKVHKKSKKAGAAIDGEDELEKALSKKDYAAAIVACARLLADEGKDAEVEVNAVVNKEIDRL